MSVKLFVIVIIVVVVNSKITSFFGHGCV